MAMYKEVHRETCRPLARRRRHTGAPAPAVAWTLAVTLAILAGPPPAHATPRYAARYQQSCSLCHHDPSGGGMRSDYAAQYLVPAEMARRPTPAEELARLDPRIGPSLAVGFDLRTVHHYYDDDRTPGNFLQMQGDVYLAFTPHERVEACFDRGMSGTYEVFGLAHVLPAGGYLKVGRFAAPYGLRLADHLAFVRDLQGFAPPGHTDVGLEAGAAPGPWLLQAAVLNGAAGSTRDTDRGLAGAGRVAVRFALGDVSAHLGGSVWRNDAGSGAATLMGPHGSLAWGPLCWVGEFGWLRSDRATGGRVTRWTCSHEFAVALGRGLDLLGTYDFHDPDADFKDGSRERLGLGGECLAYPFLQLRLFANWYRNEGPATSDEDYLQTEAQVHLLF